MRVTYRKDGVPRVLTRSVTVAKTPYSVQHLSMARRTASLYNFPGAKAEDRAVSTAIRSSTGGRRWTGDWAMPAKGRLSTPFGVRRIRNGRAVGRHRGLDIAAPTGTPIYAPSDARVVLSRTFKKYGGTIVLDHGFGVTSLYIHQSALKARAGQTVKKGELIGRIGATGVATGPHLHWSAYVHGTSIEPAFFTRMSKRGVRQ
jgi:murein DD-endopeptidase MepM/ murein hydrolase activator NlpD